MTLKWEVAELPENDRRELDLERAGRFLERLVAGTFGLRSGMLTLASRGPAPVAFARQVAMYLAHTRVGLSYACAGALFGRDRTTAAHACRIVEDRREDPCVDAVLNRLEWTIDLPPNFAGRTGR